MIDYKEVKTKDGRHLVFCNLEELVKEFYDASSIEETEQYINSNDEYIIHCPFCREEGHTKHKLYIRSDLTVGHCFVCTRAFINVTDEVDTSFKVPDFISMFYGNSGYPNVVKLTDPVWTLDRFKYEFDEFDQKGYNYLIGRHPFMAELYKILDFKFMDGNIVMPFKYHGEIFYYQIRFSGNSKIRYYFPPISAKPPYIIDHGVGIRKMIIVEGVYDAIAALIMAPDYIPCAVLGSSISDYQIDFIREYIPEKILVYLDDTKKSIGVAEKLKSRIDYCPISIIKSNGEDPEECMKRKMRYGNELQWIK